MSRLGRKPIALPKGVNISVGADAVSVKGPKGELKRSVPEGVKIKQEGASLSVTRDSDSRDHRARHGLMRALLANMVKGVTDGFERKLEINGVGYRAEVAGQKLTMALGYSHPVVYELPKGIGGKVDKNLVILTGSDRELLGQRQLGRIRGRSRKRTRRGVGLFEETKLEFES